MNNTIVYKNLIEFDTGDNYAQSAGLIDIQYWWQVCLPGHPKLRLAAHKIREILTKENRQGAIAILEKLHLKVPP